METVQARGTERLVLAIGEITTTYRTVVTPSGRAPVNDVTWTIREETLPGARSWRRALPRAGASSTVRLTVTVSGPGWTHTEPLGPATREEAAAVRARVTQARMLALRSVVWSLAGTVPLAAGPAPLQDARAPEELAAPAR